MIANMRKFVYLLFLFLLACQPKPKETSNMVTVSILPQKYLVDQISGGLLQVNVLVPPGSSPHNYEVLPSQMKNLSKSSVWLQVGLLTFEEAWKMKMSNINQNLVIANTSEGILPISGSEHHESNHEHAEAFDPHIWLAPAEVKVMAKNILRTLNTAFPENASKFGANYERFIQKIDSVSEKITRKLAPLKNREILIFHPALAYFARQFRLEQVSLELDGKEPSPKHLKEIVDLAHQKNLRVVFIQKEFDASFASQLAREIGGEVLVIDPLDYNWEKQMFDITEKIAAQE